MEAPQVWYKDGATVVAAVALAVSLVSSLISMWHTRAQDLQTAHVDLRAVLQRLLTVALENKERIEKYEDQIAQYTEQIAQGNGDARALALAEQNIALARQNIDFVNTLAAQEMNVLAAQSAKSVRSLGKTRVVSAEYMAIARAQEEAGDFDAQGDFVQKAVETAKTNNDKRNALFDSANYLFKHRRFDEGRGQFQQFLEVLRGNENFTPDQIAAAAMELHLVWAGAEVQKAGDLTAANAQIQAAGQIIQSLPEGTFRQTLQKSLDDFVGGGEPPSKVPEVPPPARATSTPTEA
jgi:tetratricopeptide (TPR) repeat protein